MKQFALTTCLLSAVSVVYAGSISINPFEEGLSSPYWSSVAGVTLEDNTFNAQTTDRWVVNGGTYTLGVPIILAAPSDTLTIVYTAKNTSDGDSVQALTLITPEQAILTGHLAYKQYSQGIQMTTTEETGGKAYVGGSAYANGSDIPQDSIVGVKGTAKSYTDYPKEGADNIPSSFLKDSEATITLQVAWSAVADQFVMSLSSSQRSDAALTLNVGETFELDSLVFTIVTGGNTSYVKDVSITANTTSIPEPATATLGILAIAGLCARRRRR